MSVKEAVQGAVKVLKDKKIELKARIKQDEASVSELCGRIQALEGDAKLPRQQRKRKAKKRRKRLAPDSTAAVLRGIIRDAAKPLTAEEVYAHVDTVGLPSVRSALSRMVRYKRIKTDNKRPAHYRV